MYAVIETGGKQQRVSVGQNLLVELLPGNMHDRIEFDRVLLLSKDDEVLIGTPTVEGAKVVATLSRQERGNKILVFRYKSKKRVRVLRGHRQNMTRIFIRDITLNGESLAPAPVQAEAIVAETTASTTESSEVTETTN